MNTKQKNIIKKIETIVKKEFISESTGHDWFHADRVRNTAREIAKQEKNVDLFTIELASLLHDIADWKFNPNESQGMEKARQILIKFDLDETTITQICHIIENISFKGAEVENKMNSKEGFIVQDADRLDALGAIGIARTFAYGGRAGREIYNPHIKPVKHTSFKHYKKNTSPTINHFYEKLLLLKDRMNTKPAKKIAQERHRFMEQFLDRFYNEVSGKE